MHSKLYGEDHLQSKENALLLCKWCHEHQAEFSWIQDLENELKKKWEAEKNKEKV